GECDHVSTHAAMRLRLYHHPDGARVAYRELGAGPPLALLHSGLLSHKEWEPAVASLAERFRVVLPDLPLHGDSEDRPRHLDTRALVGQVRARVAARRTGPAARAVPEAARPGAAAVGRQRSPAPACDRRRGARAAARRPAARPAEHGLSDGLRRPSRPRAGAHGILWIG